MHSSWDTPLGPVASQLTSMREFVAAEHAAGHVVLPPQGKILRAFEQDFAAVRVVIVGQDPYPTAGHARGLAFAVSRDQRPLPKSLQNIFTELHSDIGVEPSAHGDLASWVEQGVLLLNRCLTVREGEPASHRGAGWEDITGQALACLAARETPPVFVLWGREAQKATPLIGCAPRIESAHPSPLSAHRGFFGSKPFSRTNGLLREAGIAEIDWTL